MVIVMAMVIVVAVVIVVTMVVVMMAMIVFYAIRYASTVWMMSPGAIFMMRSIPMSSIIPPPEASKKKRDRRNRYRLDNWNRHWHWDCVKSKTLSCSSCQEQCSNDQRTFYIHTFLLCKVFLIECTVVSVIIEARH